jgi:hypothetical protein
VGIIDERYSIQRKSSYLARVFPIILKHRLDANSENLRE